MSLFLPHQFCAVEGDTGVSSISPPKTLLARCPRSPVPRLERSCPRHCQRSYSDHDPQKCGAASFGRNHSDDGSSRVEFRLHSAQCPAGFGSCRLAVLIAHLCVWLLHRDAVLFRVPQSAAVVVIVILERRAGEKNCVECYAQGADPMQKVASKDCVEAANPSLARRTRFQLLALVLKAMHRLWPVISRFKNSRYSRIPSLVFQSLPQCL